MVNTINLNVKISKSEKEKFENFCKNLGISMTTAINLFVKKVIKENRIPFTVKSEIPNKETIEAIKEVQRMKKTKKLGKVYSDPDEMIKDLLV